MKWRFWESEKRNEVDGYTEGLIAAQLERATAGNKPNPEQLASVEQAAGLWGRAFENATVEVEGGGMSMGVSPSTLALIGRNLALQGEAVFAISVVNGKVMLSPASSWTIKGGPEPSTWRYRLLLVGPSKTISKTYPNEGVLHFRINEAAQAPFRGRSPLSLAVSAGTLAAATVESLRTQLSIPIARLAQTTGHEGDARAYAEQLRFGGIITSAKGPRGDIQEDSRHFEPVLMGPDVQQDTVSLMQAAHGQVLGIFGISVDLFDKSQGQASREAWRQFVFGTIEPIARIVEAEASAKLEANIKLDFKRLYAKGTVVERSGAFKRLIDAGVEKNEALQLAGMV